MYEYVYVGLCLNYHIYSLFISTDFFVVRYTRIYIFIIMHFKF